MMLVLPHNIIRNLFNRVTSSGITLSNFIITTSQSVILYDFEQHSCVVIHRGAGLYYGIAELNGQLYVACRNNMNCYNDKNENCELIVLNNDFQEVDRISPNFEFGDVHGILAIGNEIWCTSTSDNSIVIWNSNTKLWRKWFPVNERGSDINHFNTIVSLPNSHIGIVAHNKGNSSLYIFKFHTLELSETIQLGIHAHNLWVDDRGVFSTCSSAEGRIVNTIGQIIQIGEFPRGITTTANHNLVGVSELSSRENRNTTNGYIRVFDKDWLHLYDIEYPSQGMILDVFEIDKQFNVKCCFDTHNNLEVIKESREDGFNLDSEQASLFLPKGQWSIPETYRWTIALNSKILINYNSYHSQIKIQGYNEHYKNEEIIFYINDKVVGRYYFENAGAFNVCLKAPSDSSSMIIELKILVPYLVKYNHSDNNSRNLGIAIKRIQYIKERKKEK